ncbi:MAG: UDP-glucose/GDP-mannose dehydrogenase family protein [Actinomycetota bacterium]|nr:UDP-glucose/GDP-mannose dehydrogenase family protein [Actinomycetota bacterium]
MLQSVTTAAHERASHPQRVAVVGAGYVGLTAAACLAELGHDVTCVEKDPARLASLWSGGVPILEEGLPELVAASAAAGRLRFTADIAEALEGARVALLCVGTPPRADGEPDLGQLAEAARRAALVASGDLVLVVKSTVPPGSCEAIELLAAEEAPEGVTVSIASNPEFLREGRAVFDFFNPDRLVIGAENAALAEVVAELYPEAWPKLICDRRSAELVKYAANTFLAVKISFANEVAGLCEALGADAGRVLAGVGLDGRIGAQFLSPGPGFGGSCLPKDLSGLIAVAESLEQPALVARAARAVNARVLDRLVSTLDSVLGGLEGRKIAVLGLAFKAGTDDTRQSPGLALASQLSRKGAEVRAHDPLAVVAAQGFEQVGDPYEAAEGADALVVATGWPSYRDLRPDRLGRLMCQAVVLDAAGVLDEGAFAGAGLDFYGVGRGQPTSFHPVIWRPFEWSLASGAALAAAGSPR